MVSEVKKISFLLSCSDNVLNVTITNLKEQALVLNEIDIHIVQNKWENKKIAIPNRVILIEEKNEILLPIASGTQLIMIQVENVQTFFEI